MNSYSLASDSRRWWWMPATAGAISAAATAAILVVPAAGNVAPYEPPPSTTGGTVTGSVTVVERPCYLARPGWNTARGWEQPVCRTLLRDRTIEAPGVRRPGLDFMP